MTILNQLAEYAQKRVVADKEKISLGEIKELAYQMKKING